MSDKVLLILCDGLRPDTAETCGHPFVEKLMAEYAYTRAQTVFPSYTLPCHMSLMHSMEPSEHGVCENIFVPDENGRQGLFEQLRDFGKTGAFFYSWGELRDLCAPSSLSFGSFVSSVVFGGERSAEILTEDAINCINDHAPDLVFLYLENTDVVGHISGWESEEYIDAAKKSFGLIERITENLPSDYSVFITADHGGHGFDHGTDLPCDMTIPFFVKTKRAVDEEKFKNAGIIDIAPSICEIVNIPPARAFRGKSILKK